MASRQCAPGHEGICSQRAGPYGRGRLRAHLEVAARAFAPRDERTWSVCCGRPASRRDEPCGVRRRRGIDGGAANPRISRIDVRNTARREEARCRIVASYLKIPPRKIAALLESTSPPNRTGSIKHPRFWAFHY